MARDCEISNGVKSAQEAMFRLAERDHGLTLKRISLETGISISTLISWKKGTEMSVSGLVKLSKVIPNELTSLLMEGSGKCLADAESDVTDIDDLALQSVNNLLLYVLARHPESEAGIKIGHGEIIDLKRSARALLDRSLKVVDFKEAADAMADRVSRVG